jgi:flagellar biosynthetic protein FliR
MATQNVVFANFLSIVGVTALFVTDLHLMLLRGAVDSYALFPAGLMPMAGDAARHAGDMVSASFRLGIQISAPFIVFGLVFNVGLGLLNRLMPAFQVFFVMTPVQMALSFLLFAITIAAGTSWFLEHVEAGAAQILAPR